MSTLLLDGSNPVGSGMLSWIVTAASALLLMTTKVHPLLPLAGGALIFLGKLLLLQLA
jgi:hypothetical protein